MVWETVLTITNPATLYTLDFSSYRYRVFNTINENVGVEINGASTSVPRNSWLSIENIGPYGALNGPNNFQTFVYGVLLLQRESRNTAPTQPGAFTQPTGELEIGDTRTISWGASTDAEGNLTRYELWISENGGNLGVIESNLTAPTYSLKIPTASSVKFQVRAVDSAGLSSSYRESPTYTVTKPKYYWSKYNVDTRYSAWSAERTVNQTTSFGTVDRDNMLCPTRPVYTNDGRYQNTSNPQQINSSQVGLGTPYYSEPYNGDDRCFYVEYGTKISNYTFNNILYDRERTVENYRGTLIQSGLIAEEGTYPTDGRHTDGFWYVRGSRVNQSIAPTGAFTAPTPATTLKPNQGVSVTFTASTATNISLYELEYRYNSGLWTTVGTNNTALSRSFTPTTDKTLTTVQFRVRAKNTSNVYSDYVYSEIFPIEHNAKPTITLTTADNPSLTENANLVLAGQAVDTDNGNVLTVYYQINTGTTTAIATGISNGTTPLTYSKTLQFRQGTLYDGTTSVFANLVGNQTYTLKVWAEDNQGGKSDVQTRSFTVVPNRAPIVTVAAIATTTDKINNDSITVNGTVTDPDNQTVVVKYRINNGALVQAYSGAGGNYTFNFKLASLNDGDNIVEIQGSDVYGLTTTIKRKFTKTKNKKELLESVVRYRGILPAAGITGVVAWFERENGDLTVTPTLSLTTTGESETFTNMNLSNTGPVTDTVTEEQYQLATDEPKTGMALKVNLKRTATTSDKGIKKITGALQ